MTYDVMKKIDEVPWEGHFMDEKSRIKWIYTNERDGTPMTVMVIELQEGISLPDHRHEMQPDLIYVISGKATMYIEGQGEFPAEAGMVVMVPPNTTHAVRNVTEKFVMYNVFSPAIPHKDGIRSQDQVSQD
jgi:quercetin dioxygenase-like cupin family protein